MFLKNRILFVVCIAFAINIYSHESKAEDPWEECLDDKVAQCQAESGTPNIYVCDDWDGIDEACIRCENVPDGQGGTYESFFAGCGGPDESGKNRNTECPTCPSLQTGSVIDETNGNLIKSIPIRGTGLDLVYATNKTKQRRGDFTIDYKLFDATPTFTSSYNVEIKIADRTEYFTSSSSVHDIYWAWDGLDNSGNLINKPMPVTVKVSTTFMGVVMELDFILGNANTDQYGLGDWSLSNHHFYGEEAKRLYLGSGQMVETSSFDVGGGNRSVLSDSKNEIYIFNSDGYHLQTLNALTGAVLQTFSYNIDGLLMKVTDAYGDETKILRDTFGRPTDIESSDGQITTIGITGSLISSVTTPEGDVYSMTYYSPIFLLETFTKPTGQVTTFTYDVTGAIKKASYNGGNFFDYFFEGVDDNIREYTRTSAVGREKTIRISNTVENVSTTTISPLGVSEKTTEKFGVDGGILWQRGDSSRFTQMVSDPRFGSLKRQPGTITETEGTKTKVSSYSRSVVLTDPTDVFSIDTLTTTQNVNGRVSSNVYTGSSNRWVFTSPEGRTLGTVIDSFEKPLGRQVGGLTPISYTYDLRGRLETTTQGVRVTEYTYDAEGFVASVENALGQITSFTYDDDGKPETATLPDSRVISFKYDSNNNLIKVTPAGKPKHSLAYNLFEYLSQYLPPLLSGAKPINYVYNNDKELTQVQRADSTNVDYNRNATTGVLDSIRVGSATLYAYNYSTLNGLINQASSIYGVGNLLTYEGSLHKSDTWMDLTAATQIASIENTFDNNFWVTSQTIKGVFTSSPSILNSSYDNDGLITDVNGADYTYRTADSLLDKVELGLLDEIYQYNNFGEEISKETIYGATTFYDIDYTRDDLGRIKTKTVDDGVNKNTHEFIYNVSGRLEEVKKDTVTISTYVYDDNNNRTGGSINGVATSATYDNQDRLLTYNNLTFSYNDNGERTGRTNTLLTQTTSYEYSDLGELTKITLPNLDEIEYAYDGLGRRVGRSYNGIATDFFVYDGNLRIVADLDLSTGGVKSRYIYVSQSHSPDIMVRGAEAYKFIKDHLGSIKFVLKVSDGSIAQSLAYDEFGKVLSDSNPGFQPFGFAGGIYDYQANLTKFGVRDYDAETGSWTSKDPIKFAGGDTNLYGYVLSDPINFVDKTGLARSSVDAAVQNAIQSGNLGKLEFYSDLVASPAKRKLIQNAINRLKSKATDILAKECKGRVRKEFPTDLLNKSLQEIYRLPRNSAARRKALKLLNDSRFKK